MASKKRASKKPSPLDPGPIPRDKISTLDGFLRRFIAQHKGRREQPFCFILGAGASRDSKIKTGGEMAEDWLKQLHEDRNHTGLALDPWIDAGHLDISGFARTTAARHYSQLYGLLFKDQEQAGYCYLEKEMEGKPPSYGYSVLSHILSKTHHRILITTNFDNLVTDSLAIHSDTFPIVVNDDSLVQYVRANVHRPLVVKIHGSLGFRPKSREDDLKFDEKWRKALATIFQTHTPVVIGYDGNDGSLMKLLEEMPTTDTPEFIWWCYHCKKGEDPVQRANEQPERVRKLILGRPAEMVPIPGFDLFMLRLLTLMEKEITDTPDLVESLEERTTDRLAKYKLQREELGKELAGHASTKADDKSRAAKDPKDSDLAEEAALLAKGTVTKPWWQWQIEIDALRDPERQNELYRKAIENQPHSPELLGNYALFLTNVRQDHATAEAYYKRAIEADPKNADHLGNYAIFLKNIRQDHDAAEAFYKRALEADPKHADHLGNYANFLTDIRQARDAAETFYKRALEADPKHANHLGNYANFLKNIRQDHDAAETFYKRALEANSKNANNLGNYAVFLKNIRQDHDAAETFYKRALEADPNHANNLGNYAAFLTDIRKDHDAAKAFYKRAIEADPKNANRLGNYANFLTDIRKDHDAAEAFFKRALEADPKHANNLGNYALLLTDIRKDHNAAEAFFKRALEADPKDATHLGNYGQFLIGRGLVEEGLGRLRSAWGNREVGNLKDNAELAYSLWLGTSLAGLEEPALESVFKHCIMLGFIRALWNFDAMLAAAEKKLPPADLKYAKALAAAFLSEAAVPALEKFSRWKKLQPLDPALVNADGSISKP